MMSRREIVKPISCVLLVFVHISFTFSQINYQSSVLRYGLLGKYSIANQGGEKKGTEKGFTTSGHLLFKSKPVPGKRLFQNEFVLVVSPEGVTGIDVIPFRSHRYVSPPVNTFSARTCLDRGPPRVA